MPEPKCVVTAELRLIRSDELLANEREQVRAHRSADVRRRQLGDRRTVEKPALDRGALDHGALVRLEAVDSCGEERLDRRWHRVSVPVLRSQGEQLLDEERIALGSRENPSTRRFPQVGAGE